MIDADKVEENILKMLYSESGREHRALSTSSKSSTPFVCDMNSVR
jgi:hypothetical protein